MTEFGGFFHDIFKSQSHSEGLWDLGRACRGLEETGYEHTYSLLGLLSHTVLEYELLPPAPLNPFSSRMELPDTHHFISHDRGCTSFIPQSPDSGPLRFHAGNVQRRREGNEMEDS